MKTRTAFPVLWTVVVATALVLAAPVTAQEEAPPAVNMVITATPMPGHQAAFEAGVREHMAWNQSQGNDWVWYAFQVTAGPDTGSYVFGTYGHEWADFDAPGSDPQANAEHVQATIQPHLQSAITSYTMTRADLSNYARTNPAAMYTIFNYKVKMGGTGDFEAAFAKWRAAAMAQAPELEFVIHQSVHGSEGDEYMLAIPHDSFATLGPGNPVGILAAEYGEEEAAAIANQFTNAVESYTTGLVTLRPDLSMNPAMPES